MHFGLLPVSVLLLSCCRFSLVLSPGYRPDSRFASSLPPWGVASCLLSGLASLAPPLPGLLGGIRIVVYGPACHLGSSGATRATRTLTPPSLTLSLRGVLTSALAASGGAFGRLALPARAAGRPRLGLAASRSRSGTACACRRSTERLGRGPALARLRRAQGASQQPPSAHSRSSPASLPDSRSRPTRALDRPRSWTATRGLALGQPHTRRRSAERLRGGLAAFSASGTRH